jgi:hypothetical protein
LINIAFVTEIGALAGIAFLLAFLAFMSTIMPAEYNIFGAFDFAFLGGSIIGVAGTCAIITGIPCAGALVVFGVLSLLNFIVFNQSILKPLIIIPLVIVITYLVARLSKGGG